MTTMAELPIAKYFQNQSSGGTESVVVVAVVRKVVGEFICLVSCQVIATDITETRMLPATAYFHAGATSITTDITELWISYVAQVLEKYGFRYIYT